MPKKKESIGAKINRQTKPTKSRPGTLGEQIVSDNKHQARKERMKKAGLFPYGHTKKKGK